MRENLMRGATLKQKEASLRQPKSASEKDRKVTHAPEDPFYFGMFDRWYALSNTDRFWTEEKEECPFTNINVTIAAAVLKSWYLPVMMSR
jgi:hypothetical protein